MAPHALVLPFWTVLPFAGLLLSIAILPLLAPHFWESNRNKGLVAGLFALPVALYLLLAHGEAGCTSCSKGQVSTPPSSCCSARSS